MSNLKNSSKLPHSLRIIIFLLRLAIGLNFFYAIPFSALNTPFQWALCIIGACLVLGLLTRIAAIVGIALTLWTYLPTVNYYNYSAANIAHLVNNQVIIVICLLIIIFSNAGNYLGLDSFIHIHAPGKAKE